MVASTHWLASAAGMAVLERGGNAFDAAVAAGFTLQVVEPHLNGPGGEVPALIFAVDRGEPLTLCGQGVAPAAATIERFRELGHELIPGTGVLAAPGGGAMGGSCRGGRPGGCGAGVGGRRGRAWGPRRLGVGLRPCGRSSGLCTVAGPCGGGERGGRPRGRQPNLSTLFTR